MTKNGLVYLDFSLAENKRRPESQKKHQITNLKFSLFNPLVVVLLNLLYVDG